MAPRLLLRGASWLQQEGGKEMPSKITLKPIICQVSAQPSRKLGPGARGQKCQELLAQPPHSSASGWKMLLVRPLPSYLLESTASLAGCSVLLGWLEPLLPMPSITGHPAIATVAQLAAWHPPCTPWGASCRHPGVSHTCTHKGAGHCCLLCILLLSPYSITPH